MILHKTMVAKAWRKGGYHFWKIMRAYSIKKIRHIQIWSFFNNILLYKNREESSFRYTYFIYPDLSHIC